MASEEPASEGDWTLALSEGETDIEPDQETKQKDSATNIHAEQKESMENVGQDKQTSGKDGMKSDDLSEEKRTAVDEKESPKDSDVSKGDDDVTGDQKDNIESGDTKDGQLTEEQKSNSPVQEMEIDEGIRNKQNEFAKSKEGSIDSDSTIVMDDDNIGEMKDFEESKVGTDNKKDEAPTSDADVGKVASDNQQQVLEQKSNMKESSTGDDESTKDKKATGDLGEGSPTEKKTAQPDSFHSLDLPIQPVKEPRRSRARQRSDGHPLDRSPSVASNRSEDSSGTGSSKQRKSQLQQIEGHSERRKKMVRSGFDIRPGFRLEAQDFNDKWYPAKIVEVDEEDNTLLIHFNGWNSRFDEWLNYKSDRIRPAPRQETLPEKTFTVGDTVLARWSDTRYYQGKIREINVNGSYRVKFYDGLEKTVQAGNIREMPEELKPIVSPQGYGIGDEVLARWNDCRYYPAKILSIKKNGAFRVLFYDGIEKSVQPFNVREMSAELKAQDFFKQFKAQIKASEEKNRKREKRKREEAAGSEASAPTSPTSHQPKRRSFSPTPSQSSQSKRTRHDSADSSKTAASSISVDKDASPESEKSHKSEQPEDAGPEVEYMVEKVVLRRGIGYYVNKYIYLKHRDTGPLITLRCQNVSQVSQRCQAKGYIYKDSGKAVIRGIKHNHGPPPLRNIVFCTTEDDALIPAESTSETAKDSSPLMEDVTPVSEMLGPEELEKIKERRKHIREHVLIDKSFGVLRDPVRLTAPKELIIDLDHNKYKCEVPDCGKSFRKATLLEYHKKYYHVKPTTPSVAAAAASKVLNKSKKRLSSSPTKPSSRRSSEETAATPAKVTRSQRSSAPSELGVASPTRPPMSPPLRSPSERRKSGDVTPRDRRRERSGEKSESRMKITVDAKSGKIVETKLPNKSPDSRVSRSKSATKTPEGRTSRSMSAEGVDNKTSPANESRRRRPSAPERTRQPSGAAATVKPKEVIVEIPTPEQDSVPGMTEPKVGNKDTGKDGKTTNIVKDSRTTSSGRDRKIASAAKESKTTSASKESKTTSSAKDSKTTASGQDIKTSSTVKDSNKDSKTTSNKSQDLVVVSKDINKETNIIHEPKSLTDTTAVVIKQGTTVVDKTPASTEQKDLETVKSTEQEIKKEAVSSPDVALVSTPDKPQPKTELKVSKEKPMRDRDGKSRNERAKVKHKKKHKHKHEKGKEDRARDRKAERRRKTSEKSKISDVEGKEKSAKNVNREAVDAGLTDVKLEDTSGATDAVITLEDEEMMEEEKELINCVCGYMEEEGFMLQCERCYCWQHGCCEGVNQSTAPKHYVCTFCRHPRGERVQSKYRYDQEWFNTGKLPTFKYICQDDIPDTSSTMLTTHNLMADVHGINEILHGLKHKMVILKSPNHPELGLWAHPWRHGEEWSYDADHMDTSAQETDLSYMDSSNVDTVPNSLNVSTQSFDEADVVRMDTSTDDLPGTSGMTSQDTSGSGKEGGQDKAAGSALDGRSDSKPSSTEIQQIDAQSAEDVKKDNVDKDGVEEVQRTTDIDPSIAKNESTEDTESVTKKTNDKHLVSSETNESDKSKLDLSEIEIISAVHSKSKPSEGSVFGLQAVKESKLSESLVPINTDSAQNKESKLSESLVPITTDSAPNKEQSPANIVQKDVDKPGPDKAGPSGLQQATADIDKPGPSGVQSQGADDAADKPSTSADKPSTSTGPQPVTADKPGSSSSSEVLGSQPAGNDKSDPSELQSVQSSTSGVSGSQSADTGKPDSGLQSVQPSTSGVSEKQPTETDKPGPSKLQSEQASAMEVSESKPTETDKSETSEKQSGHPSTSETPGSQPADIDKPGPSGLQSDQPSTSGTSLPADIDKPDPSNQPSTSGTSSSQLADTDKPGPSGLKPEDIPSTSADGDFAMEIDEMPAGDDTGLAEDSQMNPTEVKVTGSSVWSTGQGNQTEDIPSTSSVETRRPNIPPPAVCQANLMEHIQTMHEELFDRLALIEEQIEALEAAYAQKHGPASTPQLTNEQESALLKRKMAVLLADLEKLSNIDLTNHN